MKHIIYFSVSGKQEILSELTAEERQLLKKKLLPTMYKNNSGLIAKTKVSKYKKGLCLTEK